MTKKITETYFKELEKQTKKAYQVADKARKKNLDPENKVDIPLAENMAERVLGLISSVAPQLRDNQDLIKRIQELENKYSQLDWRVGFKIAEEVAKQKFCQFPDKLKAMEIGIRVGFSYLTLGIVAAPLEGFIELKLKPRNDGQGEYFSAFYAGPIRGAGGTAAATSVILADYVRIKMGYKKYDPSEKEINRIITEINDYHERVTNLQYKPSEEELNFLISHFPIEINGDPTEKFEVSNYKDLPRIETNRIRGGICLVIAEGLAQKAPKLWKRLAEWGKEMGLEWEWLEDFLKLHKKIKAKATSQKETEQKLKPNHTFISDIVAGRPILTHPMADGGFRLRYGRSRVSGFSAMSIHPLTQAVLKKYIAIGTQLKVERPGKAAAITTCDTLEPPIIKLENGSVIQLSSKHNTKEILPQIEEIIFLGDMLVNYGDFSENGHKLVPPGYCEEWWSAELKEKIKKESISLKKIALELSMDEEEIHQIIKNNKKPTFSLARSVSTRFKLPLHPHHTFYWSSIKPKQLSHLLEWLKKSKIEEKDNHLQKIIIPLTEEYLGAKRALELIGLPHQLINHEFVIIKGQQAEALYHTLDLKNISDRKVDLKKTTLENINTFAPFKIRDKGGTFIGARMGRPEKAKMRKLKGSPHVLFPVGKEGDRFRSFQAALEEGGVNADFPIFYCSHCQNETLFSSCEKCQKKTEQKYLCKSCGLVDKDQCQHQKISYKNKKIDINYFFKKALKKLGMSAYPDLIKGVRGTSNKDHVVEKIEKGILRAKHEIHVNKDGTTRYDMTELPITHFKPKEIGTPVEKLKVLGYQKDIYGQELKDKNQILELKPQDIILPAAPTAINESSLQVLFRVAQFNDELLKKFYHLDSFYNLKKEKDLVGHLVVGLAPHISAGLIGRIIGFSETQGCLASPLWHAGLRRDCDGDECCVMLLMDALLNFSRSFLPDKRGSRSMDAPLVLTNKIALSEIDDQAHGIDIVKEYPLQFYEAALDMKNPWDIKVEQIKDRLNTDQEYKNYHFTHHTDNINRGVSCSSYKTIPSMEEKLKGQMELASKIRAVNKEDVARLVIEKHFIKDIKGNLRKFSQQQFRCVQCNRKYRRPPLKGQCLGCGGRIIFTISEGSIIKYLEPSLTLCKDFKLPAYLTQTLEIVKRRIEGVFGKEKEKQVGLKEF